MLCIFDRWDCCDREKCGGLGTDGTTTRFFRRFPETILRARETRLLAVRKPSARAHAFQIIIRNTPFINDIIVRIVDRTGVYSDNRVRFRLVVDECKSRPPIDLTRCVLLYIYNIRFNSGSRFGERLTRTTTRIYYNGKRNRVRLASTPPRFRTIVFR